MWLMMAKCPDTFPITIKIVLSNSLIYQGLENQSMREGYCGVAKSTLMYRMIILIWAYFHTAGKGWKAPNFKVIAGVDVYASGCYLAF